MDPSHGVLISLSGDLVDLVVASDISVQLLQVTMEPRYVYRVSQRFTVRVKQPEAIVSLAPRQGMEELAREREGGGGGEQRRRRSRR